jgi:iron complex outermembrane receptor protein
MSEKTSLSVFSGASLTTVVVSALLVGALSVLPARPDGGSAPDEAPAEDKKDEPAAVPKIVEEVVVSATHAEERKDPATFSDLGKDEIEERSHGQDLAMLLAETPNAYAYSDAGNGVGYSYLSLRGFDQRRIAVNINGIPLNTPETHQVYFIDLADFAGNLDGIQVQRGTGTALYGSPAVGGVVNLETGSPSTRPGGELRVGAGSFGTIRTALGYGGPLAGGRWAYAARLSHVESDGYREPSWTRHTLGFVSLERYGSDSVLRINLFGGPERTQLAYLGVTNDYLEGRITGDPDVDRRFNPLQPGETDTFVQPHLQILHDWKIGDGLFLKNTGYVIVGRGYFRQFSDSYDFVESYGADGVPQDVSPVLEAWTRRWVGETEVGWIPRLTFDHPGGTLTVGLETLLHVAHHHGTLVEGERCTSTDPLDPCGTTEPVSSPLTLYDYGNRKTTLGFFAREMVHATERVGINVEVQATRHSFAMRDDQVRGLSFDADYSFVTPRLGANWNASDRWNVYGSVSTARSDPAFRDVWDPQDPFANPASLFAHYDPGARRYSDPLAGPEKLLDFELGAAFRGKGSTLKANVYRMRFRDELVFAGGIDDDGIPRTDNAGRSTHEGIELEGSARLPGGLTLTGYAAASRDVLDQYTLVFGPNPEDVVDYSGNRVALFPDHQARAELARRFGPVRVVLGARRIGTIYLDNSENERLDPEAREAPGYVDKKIDPYTLCDLQAFWTVGRSFGGKDHPLSLELHVENLLDRRYAAFGYAYGAPEFIPGATRSFFVGATYGF